jgi:hypothetical protein
MTVDKFLGWFGNLASISHENLHIKTNHSDFFGHAHPRVVFANGILSYFRTLCAQGNLPH